MITSYNTSHHHIRCIPLIKAMIKVWMERKGKRQHIPVNEDALIWTKLNLSLR